MQKLHLSGHVISRPHQKATSSYSWPQPISLDIILEHIQKFDRAFVLTRIEYNNESRRLRCRTASKLLRV